MKKMINNQRQSKKGERKKKKKQIFAGDFLRMNFLYLVSGNYTGPVRTASGRYGLLGLAPGLKMTGHQRRLHDAKIRSGSCL
jgi:hypothetical protein